MSRRRELKVSPSDSDDVAAEYEAAFDEAVDELEEKGVALSTSAPKTDFCGILPSNLPALDSKDLGELLGQTQTWRSYVSGLMALADGQSTALEHALKAAEAEARKRFAHSDDMKKYEKDDDVRLDPRVVELRARFLKAKIMSDFLSKSVVPSAEGSYGAVSREISRREGDLSTGMRTTNATGRRRGRGR